MLARRPSFTRRKSHAANAVKPFEKPAAKADEMTAEDPPNERTKVGGRRTSQASRESTGSEGSDSDSRSQTPSASDTSQESSPPRDTQIPPAMTAAEDYYCYPARTKEPVPSAGSEEERMLFRLSPGEYVVAGSDSVDETVPPCCALQGYLLKRHYRNPGTWAKRYFMVNDRRGTLAYSKGEKGKKSNPTVVLPLHAISRVVAVKLLDVRRARARAGLQKSLARTRALPTPALDTTHQSPSPPCGIFQLALRSTHPWRV